MLNHSWFLDRSQSWEGTILPLPDDFLDRFVTAAKWNGTLDISTYSDEYGDGVFSMRGRDADGRELVATWNAHPAYQPKDGTSIVLWRDTAQDRN